ncbi:hypothetical protein ACE38W_00980 [Chitinophaga sp. Hz27]|uniref:DUF7192 family protein n=1 Tax=Chitinophaga sp. Hz27 TaxID=3347169 RepID=UPI0035DADD75
MLQAFIKDDFKNLLEYQAWVNESMDHLNRNKHQRQAFSEKVIKDVIMYQPSWFGKGTTYEELKSGITTFKNPALIDKIYNKVNDKVTVNVRQQIKSKKVNFNAMGLGVFIFDRAAMGMFRLKEYYSLIHDLVVDSSAVRKVKNKYSLISDGTEVIERWEQQDNGMPKIRTTSKNVYAYFPKRDREKRSVEIYLSIGGSSEVDADDFIYSGVSAIIVAQLLEHAHISTKISIVVGTSPDNFKKSVFASIVPIKNFDESIDVNLLALLSSDPRFYRYDGFKGVVSTYEHFNATVPDDMGYGFNHRNNLKATIENSTYTASAKLAPNRIYMGRIFSEQEAIADIESTIKQLAETINS